MNTWKVILATVLIFGTGVVTGGLLVRHSDHARSRSAAPGQARIAPVSLAGGARFDFLRRMERELDLTADQRERIDKLIKESQERTRKLMEPVTPQLKDEVRRTKEQFRQILTPAQQARFDELSKRAERTRDARRPLRAPGS